MTIILEGFGEQLEVTLKSRSSGQFVEMEGIVMSATLGDKQHDGKVGTIFYILGQEKKLNLPVLGDPDLVIKEIDNIFAQLTQIDNRISQTQLGIDNLKSETRGMLAALIESIV